MDGFVQQSIIKSLIHIEIGNIMTILAIQEWLSPPCFYPIFLSPVF